MPLTRDFDETVKARARRDPEFRDGLLSEAVDALLRGEIEVGKALAAEAAATTAELVRHVEDQTDAAILCERLEATDASAYIPHVQVAADVSG